MSIPFLSGDAVSPGDIAAFLPPLPARMAGHPFGADDAGRPITHVKGPVIVGTIGYMLDCVAQRAAAPLSPEISAVEREARLRQVREQALGQLVERLNAAIADPLYHVTPDYLMDDHHSYSMEFMVFLDGICYELSGEPRYHFESGARSFPSSLTYLVRPLSVSQGYALVPRVTALFQDTDVRVAHVGPGVAVIQWYAAKDTAQVSENLKQRVIFGTCQGLQGVFAQIPRIVAGLPVAKVREMRCILRSDACCEWEFTWQEPRRRGLYRLWPRASQEDALQGAASPPTPSEPTAPIISGSGSEKPAPAPTGSFELAQRDDLPKPISPAESAAISLPPLPAYMVGHPFGADEAGRPITHTKGHVIRGAVEYMLECVVRRAVASLPAETESAEREAHLARARAAALEELVARLNAAIPDPLYHVTADYLLNEAHSYSTEFDAFACEICRLMSGDPRYHFNRGAKTIPASLAYLGRPFSLTQVYKMLPRLVSKFAEGDMRYVQEGPNSAVIQYRANREMAELAEDLRPIYLLSACQHSQGALAQLPRIVAGLPVACVKELQCMLRGDPCCEWEFTWESVRPRVGVGVWGGVLASLLLLSALVLRLIPLIWLAGLAVLLPLTAGLMAWQLKRVSHDRDQQRRLLLDQRESAEKHYDELQQASAGLQLSNAALQHRLSELTALHEIGLVTGATLDLDKLLHDSLNAVIRYLGFDRALVLLVDEERRVLMDGCFVGGASEVVAAAREMIVSLDNENSFLSQAVRLGQPVLVTDATQVADEQTLRYVQALKARRFIATPLLMHGAALGVLAVDNAITDRPVTEDSFGLLMTVGSQIAGAIDRVRLYQTLEQRIAQRTAELAQATREAQRERLYSEALIQNSPVAIVSTDAATNVVTWNPAAERLFGFTAEEARGRNLDELVANNPAIQSTKAETLIHNLQAAAQAPVHAIAQRTRWDGSLVDVEVWAAPVIISGEETRVLVLYHDLTEIKQAEAALQQAKETAEAATQAKSDFLATMSHEIRTPMNAIIGMAGLLLDTSLDADQREFAETVRSSGDALLTIINDILDFSKMEAGKMDLEQQPFDVRECVESALDLLKLKASEKGLELACEFAADVPPAISGDVTRLRQVLVNLLSNGVKFTEQGEVVVAVECRGEDVGRADGRGEATSPFVKLHFVVRDTGIGIPPDRLSRLFQAFSQVDSSTTRKYGGTGLGLAVSKRLSEMMGGSMWVESEGVPGKGSSFHFTIRAPEASEAAQSPSRREAPELRGRRVLVVDDNATNRRILALQAQGWGMHAHVTDSPEEALEWLRQGAQFDVGVLDLNMPEMDGVELAGKVRGLAAISEEGAINASGLPLILLSSLGSYGKEIPADLFTTCLTKPIRASALFDALMSIFAGQQAVAPASIPAQPDVEMAQRLPLRILVAEDYVVNQKLALRLLAQMGYRADLAANGLEAIQALERQPYDVVLMDVQMPEMDGLEATRQICARWPARERPRIIAMTANAMQGDREVCLAAGMDDYVSKPIRAQELIQALGRCRPLVSNRAPA